MTNAELAILSLIAEQPRHGYEIEQVIQERGMRDWTEIGFSSIYYLLKKLEKAGWVSSQLDAENEQGPARRVYAITDAGRLTWYEATLDVLTNPRPIYDPFQLGLANLPGIPPEEAIHALAQYRDQMQARLDYMKTQWERSGAPPPDNVNAMFDLSVTIISAEVAWLEQFIQRLEQKRSR